MKRRLLRRLTVLFGWMLGLGGCDNVGAPEYGVPSADFDLDGKVVEVGTTNGIPGIEIQFDGVTVTSDANGDWTMTADGAFACSQNCNLTARDVDGEQNGSYADATKNFTATQITDGSGTWYNGEWQAHDITIEMEPTNGSSGA